MHTNPAYVHTQTDDSKVIIINVMVCARVCVGMQQLQAVSTYYTI